MSYPLFTNEGGLVLSLQVIAKVKKDGHAAFSATDEIFF